MKKRYMIAGLSFLSLTVMASLILPVYAAVLFSNPDEESGSNANVNSFYIVELDPSYDPKDYDKSLFAFVWEYIFYYTDTGQPASEKIYKDIPIKSVSLGDHKITLTIDHKEVENVVPPEDQYIGASVGYVLYDGEDFAGGAGPGWRKRG